MQKASISQLKNGLSAYLDRVRSGETVLITDRDLPIARIERIDDQMTVDERLLRLQRAGLVRLATHPLTPDLLRQRVMRTPSDGPGAGVLQALLDERADGR